MAIDAGRRCYGRDRPVPDEGRQKRTTNSLMEAMDTPVRSQKLGPKFFRLAFWNDADVTPSLP